MTARRIREGPSLVSLPAQEVWCDKDVAVPAPRPPARFPGLLGEHNPLLSPCRVLALPCLHFSPAAAEAGVRWRRHPRIRQSPACRCRRLPSPGPIPPVCGLIPVCRVATSASAFLPVVEKRGEKPCIQPPASRRVVPCLHFSPAAADAGALTPPSSPGRRFYDARLLPVVFSLRFRSKPSRPASRYICAAASGVALHLPLFAGLSCRHGTTRCRSLCDYGGLSMQYVNTCPVLNVEESDRLSFMPYLFGTDFMLAELQVYALAKNGCPAMRAASGIYSPAGGRLHDAGLWPGTSGQ
uniref:Uncharacterized protein n=1 Tax=Klebsiella pneumoniae TaxID=573 RepID=A0A2P1BQ19_KLEPN|nr:hypothetical protein [Klebsiella pneumoniae]